MTADHRAATTWSGSFSTGAGTVAAVSRRGAGARRASRGADVSQERMPDRSPWEHFSYKSLVDHRPDRQGLQSGDRTTRRLSRIRSQAEHRRVGPARRGPGLGAVAGGAFRDRSGRSGRRRRRVSRSVRAQRSSQAPRATRAASREPQAPASGSYWIVRRRLGFVTVIASISSSDTPTARRRGRNVSAR